MDKDNDWKRKLSFPVNYSSDEDQDDADVVVMRSATSANYLLADRGDGAEADLLGSTPPRMLHRDKEKRRTRLESAYVSANGKRGSSTANTAPQPATGSSRIKQLSDRILRKQQRRSGRDMKVEGETLSSMPSPPAVPTLVESCNRFMSLTSRLKCRERESAAGGEEEEEEVERRRAGAGAGGALGARQSFHQTFSLLINMGSVDKGCRRTISREEQVWQNELKDLIWLELQAKLAGRTPAQQDAFLCAQRNIVPTIVQNIKDYRFVNPESCTESRPLDVTEGSREDLTSDGEGKLQQTDQESTLGCLSLSCARCALAVGKALREVGTLLDSFYCAATLYPSTKAMTHDHPLIATQLFKNRLKAMCLWYNTALYTRLKVIAVRRMLRTVRQKMHDRTQMRLASTESELSRQSSESRRCAVRFNVSNTPSDSNNSDSSAQSEHKESSEEHKESSEENPVEDRKEGEGGEKEEKRTDEVDSGTDRRLDCSGQTTPEIIITDKYGTADTVSSVESGYVSARDSDGGRHADDVYDLGSLEDVTQLRLLDKCPVSLYREYHREMLKTQGVRRCMMFINKMRLNVLHKVYETLEKPDSVKSRTTEEETVEVFDDTKEEEDKSQQQADDEDAQRKYELRRFGCWSAETQSMRLPSYRNHFLLLSSICMEAVHDYLTLRLEDRPVNPSCLTVKQLIHELKEGLDIATEMRAAFARNVEVSLAGHRAGRSARRELLLLVRTYDHTVETALKQYLSYVSTMSAVEQLCRAALQAEWSFTARLAKRVRCAAVLAPLTFSEIACNQVNRVLRQLDVKFSELKEQEKQEIQDSDSDKHTVFSLCRTAQAIYAGEREGALQAAQWARALAARLARAPPRKYIAQRKAIFESLMNLRNRIVEHTQYIEETSREIGGYEDPRDLEATAARVRELLLQLYRLGFELHKELHQMSLAPLKLERVCGRVRPASLPPRRPAPPRPRPRPETLFIHESYNPTLVHKELHRFVNENREGATPPPAAARRRAPSPPRRHKLLRSDSLGEDPETNVFDDKLFENINNFGDGQTRSSIELLLIGENPDEKVELRNGNNETWNGSDVMDGCDGVTETEKAWAVQVSRGVVQFARCWMRFVLHRCDKGRGLRPRWASQGLEFLMLACDPCNTKHLTDEEFEDLKKEMDGCISHVIGCRQGPRSADVHLASPDPARRWPRHGAAVLPVSVSVPAGAPGKQVPAPPTPPLEPDPLLSFHGFQPHAHIRRVMEAVQSVDLARDEKLRSARRVGRVLESSNVSSFEPKLRQLKFKWQRGLKIGAGTFGKVYTVVNTESGQLLAMKELSVSLCAGRAALRRAANELQVLEGVVHPHLVRYYGCELHREEMLIFMELCVEGSLEALVGTSGALAEHTVRRYTRQLLSAVSELHARGIAHRDVKSGNIFLTNEGHCLKLGDFGCAVKIRAHSTAQGELQGYVGTQAYMAPEVFMKSSGHGRAADIWSLGCVVTEMASGKRPWSEYDSNYQIMFVVGMGGRPEVPDSLSAEGQDFCRACLTHEPDQRPKANELMLHHFLMVKSDDDDCKCEPAHLIT